VADQVRAEEHTPPVQRRDHHYRLQPRHQLELAAVSLGPARVEIKESRHAALRWGACVVVVEGEAATVALVALQLDGDARVCDRSRPLQRPAARIDEVQLREGGCRVVLQLQPRQSGYERGCMLLNGTILELRLQNVGLDEDFGWCGRAGLEPESVLPQSTRLSKLCHVLVEQRGFPLLQRIVHDGVALREELRAAARERCRQPGT